MSHFTVSVITEGCPLDNGVLEEVLAPYYEHDESFYEFINAEDRYKYDYKKLKGKYPTIESYYKDYLGLEYNEEEGAYGYYANPNAKWDWYQVGGRWSGMLTTKQGEICDCARIKDVVIPDYSDDYDNAIRKWELIVEGAQPVTEEEKEMLEFNFYTPEYYTNNFGSKEEYAEYCSTFTTLAVIDKDGQWHEEGEVLYFGMVDSNKGQMIEYTRRFKDIVFNNAGDNDYITIVDCHI